MFDGSDGQVDCSSRERLPLAAVGCAWDLKNEQNLNIHGYWEEDTVRRQECEFKHGDREELDRRGSNRSNILKLYYEIISDLQKNCKNRVPVCIFPDSLGVNTLYKQCNY